MNVYIIGTGVNGSSSLTREAVVAIEHSQILIGAERMLAEYSGCGKKLVNAYKPEEICNILRSCTYNTASVLMSGDCGFFSGTKKLLPLIEDMKPVIISGISSAAYFCSRINLSYEAMKFISLHGKNANIAVNVRMNEKCFFLLGGDMDAADICRRLCKYGLSDVTVHIGENLGYQIENCRSGKARDLMNIHTEKLSVLVTENPDYLRYIPSAISDSEFIRSSIPMTKSAVRGNIVSRLNICHDSVCWDIGCGTGSVSVEMAFRCPDGKVMAFDKKSEAAELTARNAQKFGCDNIFVNEGICPDVLKNAPSPDKVFVGGSCGNMAEIFECAYQKNEFADITVSAVSLETLEQAVRAFERFGREYSVMQIAVTETRKLGSHTMLTAQNPVFIIKSR